MGMIYKRGNVWWIKYYRNGKHFRESSKLSVHNRTNGRDTLISQLKSFNMGWTILSIELISQSTQ